MSEISSKKLVRRFLASKKEAAPRGNDAEILLGDLIMTQNEAHVKPVGDGAVGTFTVGWLSFTIRMSEDGEYLIEASGKARGKIPYMPYEDHHEMASDLLSGDTDFSLLRRL